MNKIFTEELKYVFIDSHYFIEEERNWFCHYFTSMRSLVEFVRMPPFELNSSKESLNKLGSILNISKILKNFKIERMGIDTDCAFKLKLKIF